MSTIPNTTTGPSVLHAVHDERLEHARLAVDPAADALFHLLVAGRRTLEQAAVLAGHDGDLRAAAHVALAMGELSRAMDIRVMGHHS